MAFCTSCGAEFLASDKFCRKCGAQARRESEGKGDSVGNKNRSSANKRQKRLRAKQINPRDNHVPARPVASSSEATQEFVATPSAAEFKDLSPAEARKLVIKAGIKALTKSLTLSAAVLGPGLLLLLAGQLILGMVLLFVGSFGLVAYSYHKPWRLSPLSCLIPPLTAAACYVIQLVLFGDASPPGVLLLVAIGLGVAIGAFRGRAHEVYVEKGGVFAQRTITYLVIWIAAYAITQLLGMTAANVWAVRGGLVMGAFSTAMLAMVSIVLFRQRHALRGTATATIMLGLMLAMQIGGAPTTALAQTNPNQLGRTAYNAIQPAVRAFLPTHLGCQLRFHNGGPTPNVATAWIAYECQVHKWHKYRIYVKAFAGFDKAANWLDGRRKWQSKNASQSTRHTTKTFANASIGDRGIIYTNQYLDKNFSTFSFEASGTKGGWQVEVKLNATLPPGRRPTGFASQVATGVAADVARRLPNILSRVGQAEQSRRQQDEQRARERDKQRRAQELLERLQQSKETDKTEGPSVESATPSIGTSDESEGTWFPPDADETIASIALTTAILIAAGIAANVAQAMAAAIANALQAGVEMTSQEISHAIFGGAADRAPTTENGSIRAPKPPPPIHNPNDGKPFETNADGQYFAPDEKGDWRWMSSEKAQNAAAAIRAELKVRGQEIAEHRRQTEHILEESRQNTQERYAQERAAEKDLAQASEEDFERRQRLMGGIEKTLLGLPEDERYRAMMARLGKAQVRGDKQDLHDIWSELRATRQGQVNKLSDTSSVYQRQAGGLGMLESAATSVRDFSKGVLAMGLGTVSGGSLTLLEAAAMTTVAGGGLTAEGALEGGLKVKDGEVEFDQWEATRGAARGARTALGALVGGTPANGNRAIALSKVGFGATSDAAQTYADVHNRTGDRVKAAEKAKIAFGVSAAKEAMGEAWDESGRLAEKRAEAGNISEGLHDTGSKTWADAVAENQKMVNAAGKRATNFMSGVANDMAVNDKDFVTAIGNAAKNEAYSAAAGKLVNATNKPSAETTDAQRKVAERLQAERMDAASHGTREGIEAADGKWASKAPNVQEFSPADREAAANADYRDRQRKVWEAGQRARELRAEADASPEDTTKQIDAIEAENQLGQAESEQFKAGILAQEATEAARGQQARLAADHQSISEKTGQFVVRSQDQEDGPYTGRSILDVPREELGPVQQKVQDYLKKHGDLPTAEATPSEVKQRAQNSIALAEGEIGHLRNQLENETVGSQTYKDLEQDIADQADHRQALGRQIVDINKQRIDAIELEQARLKPVVDSFGTDDATAAETQRYRELEQEAQLLKQESRTAKSDYVASQVNERAGSEAVLPAGLSRQHAAFDITSDGGSDQLPATAEEIRQAVRTHVDTKGANSPYQSWTGKRQIATSDGVAAFPGDKLAVAHIPVDEFNRMLGTNEALPPSVVSSNTTRSGNLVEQEYLIHEVPQQYWRVETPEVREVLKESDLMANGDSPHPSYVDQNGNEFVILYRSMSDAQFPNDTRFL